ncbi:hypothetical protein A2U01_0047069, partial [Trifolium medium]|nr:hypothetical protein [Trifolium medium]
MMLLELGYMDKVHYVNTTEKNTQSDESGKTKSVNNDDADAATDKDDTVVVDLEDENVSPKTKPDRANGSGIAKRLRSNAGKSVKQEVVAKQAKKTGNKPVLYGPSRGW